MKVKDIVRFIALIVLVLLLIGTVALPTYGNTDGWANDGEYEITLIEDVETALDNAAADRAVSKKEMNVKKDGTS